MPASSTFLINDCTRDDVQRARAPRFAVISCSLDAVACAREVDARNGAVQLLQF